MAVNPALAIASVVKDDVVELNLHIRQDYFAFSMTKKGANGKELHYSRADSLDELICRIYATAAAGEEDDLSYL